MRKLKQRLNYLAQNPMASKWQSYDLDLHNLTVETCVFDYYMTLPLALI